MAHSHVALARKVIERVPTILTAMDGLFEHARGLRDSAPFHNLIGELVAAVTSTGETRPFEPSEGDRKMLEHRGRSVAQMVLAPRKRTTAWMRKTEGVRRTWKELKEALQRNPGRSSDAYVTALQFFHILCGWYADRLISA